MLREKHFYISYLHHQTATTHPLYPSLVSSGIAGWPPGASGQTHSVGQWGSSCLQGLLPNTHGTQNETVTKPRQSQADGLYGGFLG